MPPVDELLTEHEAAEYLRLKVSTLRTWRCTGRHNLAYHKIGRTVRYSQADLDAWLESCRMGGESVEARR